MKIGFIGQGWIGKHYADDFESRGYNIVRYGLEPEFTGNREKIGECDITFVAVPTPTTQDGFQDAHVHDALSHIGRGKTVVIKSTIIPGTTKSLQEHFPDIFVMHSPEFLMERTAAYDAGHPLRNIVGIPENSSEYRDRAEKVLAILPHAPYARIMSAENAELVKYAGNCFLFTKVLYVNLLHDLVVGAGGKWEEVRDAFIHDPRVGESHTEPLHEGGRGAGGDCFIKDFETFRLLYKDIVGDEAGDMVLRALVQKNIRLLAESGKSKDLLAGVYGDIEAKK